MARRTFRAVLFLLLLAALLCPANNFFQPQERTNLFTDTEYQVAAIAFSAGLYVVVAFLLVDGLSLGFCLSVTLLPQLSAPCHRRPLLEYSPSGIPLPLLIPLRI